MPRSSERKTSLKAPKNFLERFLNVEADIRWLKRAVTGLYPFVIAAVVKILFFSGPTGGSH